LRFGKYLKAPGRDQPETGTRGLGLGLAIAMVAEAQGLADSVALLRLTTCAIDARALGKLL